MSIGEQIEERPRRKSGDRAEEDKEDPGLIVDAFLASFDAGKEIAWRTEIQRLQQWVANGNNPHLRQETLLDGIDARIEGLGGRKPRNYEMHDRQALLLLKKEISATLLKIL